MREGGLFLLASTAGDSSPTAIGSGSPSLGGRSEPAIPGPDAFALGGPPPPALPDQTETARVVLRFLRSGTEVLGGTDGALVCPQVKGEIYQLGMALAVWAAPDAWILAQGFPGLRAGCPAYIPHGSTRLRPRPDCGRRGCGLEPWPPTLRWPLSRPPRHPFPTSFGGNINASRRRLGRTPR
jgi:hypothetical protein